MNLSLSLCRSLSHCSRLNEHTPPFPRFFSPLFQWHVFDGKYYRVEQRDRSRPRFLIRSRCSVSSNLVDVVLCQCDCAQLRVRVKTQILHGRADCSFLTVRVFENWPRRVTYPSTYRTHISSQIIAPQSTSLGGGGEDGDRGEV